MADATLNEAPDNKNWFDLCEAYERHVLANDGKHVAVPKTNVTLHKWVANQRHHYKLFYQGKPNFLTDVRITKLDSIGFVWTVNNSWTDRFEELQRYFNINGNVKVSRSDQETIGLGEWLKKQNKLLCTLPKNAEDLAKAKKLLSVRFLFDDNALWKAVIKLTSANNPLDSTTTIANEFLTMLRDYFAMLLQEYQRSETPSISTQQAEQLQCLLQIPRTSIDIKRRKKGHIPLVPPLLPPVPANLLYVTSVQSPAVPMSPAPETVLRLSATVEESLEPTMPLLLPPISESNFTGASLTIDNSVVPDSIVHQQSDVVNTGPSNSIERHSSSDSYATAVEYFPSDEIESHMDQTVSVLPDCNNTEDIAYEIEEVAVGKPTFDDNQSSASPMEVIATATTQQKLKSHSNALYDWCPVLDTLNTAVEGGQSFQVQVTSTLTTELCKYVKTSGLHTYFKNSVFDWKGFKERKTVPNSPTKTYQGNESYVFPIGKSRSAKPCWQFVKVPNVDTDMIFVYPYDCVGYQDVEAILLENEFDKVLQSIADHENRTVQCLNILYVSFVVTRRNDKERFHWDFEPGLQGMAWNILIPLVLVKGSVPELVFAQSLNSIKHQTVKYQRNTAVVLGANQLHSSGIYNYSGERFRYCLSVTVAEVTLSNAREIVKSMDSYYPLRGESYLLDLSTRPHWKLSSTNEGGGTEKKGCEIDKKPSKKDKQKAVKKPEGVSNDKAIELRGSSEERSLSNEAPKRRTSPRRRKKFAMPLPDTILEDSGFDALMKYSKEREDEVIVSWDTKDDAFWGKSFLSLRKGHWLNDEVISGFFLLLRQQEFKGKYFFRTQFALQVVKDGKYCYTEVERYFSTKRTRTKKKIFMYDHVYFPINQDNSHWILIEFVVATSVLNVYDSWAEDNANDWVEKIIQYISDEYKRLYRNEYPKMAKLRQNVKYIKCPKQENGYDCGVFVCLFGYYLATEQKMAFTPDYVANFRKTIAKCLVTQQLP